MSTQRNRRKHERHAVELDALVEAVADDKSGTLRRGGTLVDISKGGVCIALEQMLHPGTEAVIQIVTRGTTIIEAAEVRSVRYDGNRARDTGRGHLVGFRLLQDPPSREVAELVERVRRTSVA